MRDYVVLHTYSNNYRKGNLFTHYHPPYPSSSLKLNLSHQRKEKKFSLYFQPESLPLPPRVSTTIANKEKLFFLFADPSKSLLSLHARCRKPG
jgi:hypothetical protein